MRNVLMFAIAGVLANAAVIAVTGSYPTRSALATGLETAICGDFVTVQPGSQLISNYKIISVVTAGGNNWTVTLGSRSPITNTIGAVTHHVQAGDYMYFTNSGMTNFDGLRQVISVTSTAVVVAAAGATGTVDTATAHANFYGAIIGPTLTAKNCGANPITFTTANPTAYAGQALGYLLPCPDCKATPAYFPLMANIITGGWQDNIAPMHLPNGYKGFTLRNIANTHNGPDTSLAGSRMETYYAFSTSDVSPSNVTYSSDFTLDRLLLRYSESPFVTTHTCPVALTGGECYLGRGRVQFFRADGLKDLKLSGIHHTGQVPGNIGQETYCLVTPFDLFASNTYAKPGVWLENNYCGGIFGIDGLLGGNEQTIPWGPAGRFISFRARHNISIRDPRYYIAHPRYLKFQTRIYSGTTHPTIKNQFECKGCEGDFNEWAYNSSFNSMGAQQGPGSQSSSWVITPRSNGGAQTTCTLSVSNTVATCAASVGIAHAEAGLALINNSGVSINQKHIVKQVVSTASGNTVITVSPGWSAGELSGNTCTASPGQLCFKLLKNWLTGRVTTGIKMFGNYASDAVSPFYINPEPDPDPNFANNIDIFNNMTNRTSAMNSYTATLKGSIGFFGKSHLNTSVRKNTTTETNYANSSDPTPTAIWYDTHETNSSRISSGVGISNNLIVPFRGFLGSSTNSPPYFESNSTNTGTQVKGNVLVIPSGGSIDSTKLQPCAPGVCSGNDVARTSFTFRNAAKNDFSHDAPGNVGADMEELPIIRNLQVQPTGNGLLFSYRVPGPWKGKAMQLQVSANSGPFDENEGHPLSGTGETTYTGIYTVAESVDPSTIRQGDTDSMNPNAWESDGIRYFFVGGSQAVTPVFCEGRHAAVCAASGTVSLALLPSTVYYYQLMGGGAVANGSATTLAASSGTDTVKLGTKIGSTVEYRAGNSGSWTAATVTSGTASFTVTKGALYQYRINGGSPRVLLP